MQGNSTAALATPLGPIGVGGSIDVGSSAVGKDAGASMIVGPNESNFVSVFGNTDADYYSFNVSSAVKLNAVLTPRGGMFNQGQEGGPAPTPFDADNRNDLLLALFGPDGTTQLALINNTGAGSAETLSGLTLPSAGQYFVRVTGATADSVQLYDLALSVAAIPGLPGDYNRNNFVDAADYVTWRKNDGTQAGYETWRANFGTPSSGSGRLLSASVPEPTSVLLLVFGAGCWSFARPGRIESSSNASTRDTGHQWTVSRYACTSFVRR